MIGLLFFLASAMADTPPQIINKQCSSHQFFSQIQPGSGNINCTQPAYSDLSGSAPVSSVFGRTGAVVAGSADYSLYYCALTGCTFTADVNFGNHNITHVSTLSMVGGSGGISGLYEISAATVGGPIYVINSQFNLDGNPIVGVGTLNFLGGASISEGPAPDVSADPDATNFYDPSGNILGSFYTDPNSGDVTFNFGSGLGIGTSAYLQADGGGSISLNTDPSGGGSVINFTANSALNAQINDTGVYVNQLVDSTPTTSIDPNNRTMYDGGNVLAVDYSNRLLTDFNQDASVLWGYYQLADSFSNLSVDWGGRILSNFSGQTSVLWDDGNNNVIIEPPSGTLEILVPTTSNNLISATSGFATGRTVDSATTTPVNGLSPTSGYVTFTGAATITLNGIVAGTDGQEIRLQNLTGNNMTIADNGGTVTGKKIRTGTGTNHTLATNGTCQASYNSSTQFWYLYGCSN